ncbi:MAG: GGDEF domain-containing protein [Spirochaetes bacterium]|nr:GGDEF domain-containing protein [Spirochaetota bacterium]
MERKRILRIKVIITGIFIVALLCIFSILLYSNLIVYSQQNKKIFLDNFFSNGKKDNLTYQIKSNNAKETIVYKMEIPKKEFDRIDSEYYKIVMYRIASHWYKVYFNGILIGSVGNLENDSSIVWNTISFFDIDKNLIKDNNEITIVIYYTYEIGALSFPPIITNIKEANKLMNWFNFVLANIYIIAIGIMWFSFLLLIILSNLMKNSKKEYLYYSLATLFFSFYIFDNILIYDMMLSTIIFKKIIFSCLYLSVSFVSLAIYKEFKGRINLISIILILSSILIIVFFSNNMVLLKKMTSIFNILIILNILGWIYSTFKNLKTSNDAKVIFTSSIFLILVTTYDVFFMALGKTGIYNTISTNILGSIFFSLIVIVLVVFDYIELYSKMSWEKERADLFYEKSSRDALTGIYNRQYVETFIENSTPPFSLLMIDTDHFKEINDTYGHLVGDEIIKYIARESVNNVRSEDVVGRWGGDEFVIVFKQREKDNSLYVAEKVRNAIKKPYSIDGLNFNITLSMGLYTAENKEENKIIFKKADDALYVSKENGRDRITVWEERISSI